MKRYAVVVTDATGCRVARDPIDFRRQFDRLAGIARDELGMPSPHIPPHQYS
jgi:hypothetical protein